MAALVLFVVAVALIVAGIAQVSVPAAMIVAGVLALGLAVLVDLRTPDATPDEAADGEGDAS